MIFSVFFSSDHGDFGGDYGLVEKWPGSMADVLTRVPLYARIPGGVSGHVSMAPVQTADVLETMLDAANITKPSWIRFGKSLLPQLHGAEGAKDRYVFSEGGFYFENEQMIEAGGWCCFVAFFSTIPWDIVGWCLVVWSID